MIEADPANIEQMQTAINQAYESFERIHGVFYVTPMSDEKSSFSIQEIGRDESELQFKSKIYRSEEHTSELQSRQYLVCRLLLEKKKKKHKKKKQKETKRNRKKRKRRERHNHGNNTNSHVE